MGNDTILKELSELAEKLGVMDHIIFGDYVTGEALAQVYSQAQAIVQTSVGEGFGMNLVEAFSYGVPAVSYNITYGTHELVEDGVNGFVTVPGAYDQMAEGLASILSDDGIWADMSDAAYKKAKEFTADKVYPMWQEALTK